jgi:hypothetical protein
MLVLIFSPLALSGPMLAHKGIEEGIFVAEFIAEQHSPINYHTIPNVIYTDPEIAWVGQTEQDLLARGENIKTSIFPFNATSRSQIKGATSGPIMSGHQWHIRRVVWSSNFHRHGQSHLHPVANRLMRLSVFQYWVFCLRQRLVFQKMAQEQ